MNAVLISHFESYEMSSPPHNEQTSPYNERLTRKWDLTRQTLERAIVANDIGADDADALTASALAMTASCTRLRQCLDTNTSLWSAIEKNMPDVVEFLLPVASLQQQQQQQAIRYACGREYVEIVRLLLADGRFPLAPCEPVEDDVLRRILYTRPDEEDAIRRQLLNIRMTELECASSIGNLELVRLLASWFANGHEDVVRFLIDVPAQPDDMDTVKVAARLGRYEMIRLYIARIPDFATNSSLWRSSSPLVMRAILADPRNASVDAIGAKAIVTMRPDILRIVLADPRAGTDALFERSVRAGNECISLFFETTVAHKVSETAFRSALRDGGYDALSWLKPFVPEALFSDYAQNRRRSSTGPRVSILGSRQLVPARVPVHVPVPVPVPARDPARDVHGVRRSARLMAKATAQKTPQTRHCKALNSHAL